MTNFLRTNIVINRPLAELLRSAPFLKKNLPGEKDLPHNSETFVLPLGRRSKSLLGLLQESEYPDRVRILIQGQIDYRYSEHHPNRVVFSSSAPRLPIIQALVHPLRALDIDPDDIASVVTTGADISMDADELRQAVAYPFPDEPNAEVCVITGGRANARVYEYPLQLSGWYGSTIADMTSFAIVDRSMPIGPICDDEIRKALAAGRIILNAPLSSEELSSTSDDAIKALIDLGISIAENHIANGNAGDMPLGRVVSENDEALAYPFIDALQGFHTPEGVDLVGIGRLMAMVAELRSAPLTPGPVRDQAIERVIHRLKRNSMDDLSLDDLQIVQKD